MSPVNENVLCVSSHKATSITGNLLNDQESVSPVPETCIPGKYGNWSPVNNFWDGFISKWNNDQVFSDEYRQAKVFGLIHMYDDAQFSSLDEIYDYLRWQDSHDRVAAFFHVWNKIKHFDGIDAVVRYVWTTGKSGDFSPESWVPVFYEVDFPPVVSDGKLSVAFRKPSFVVYRGGEAGSVAKGLSWTLSKTVAAKFSTMIKWNFSNGGFACFLPEKPVILKATATIQDVLWYTNDRNERECVMSPDWLERQRFA